MTFTPPDSATFNINGSITMITNDPDPGQNPFQMHVVGNSTNTQINVGDAITPQFGFLDPSGAGQVGALDGNVVVLAYFALF